ncbi:MAG: HDOD domain-containing protein [Thermodesulfovibrionales bacterium]|nr:HDOD domain-containing protein [Thermodesulfovibrionales bacterium]
MNVKLRYEIENIHNIPTIAPMLRKLIVLIEDPTLSMNELSMFVSKDPALTARIIKFVNSPIYRTRNFQPITSINQAMLMLGMNAIKGILLGVSVFDYMEKTMEGLWLHSAGCAGASKIIAELTLNVDIVEDIVASAILHDIGKVILNLKYPQEYRTILNNSKKKNTSIYDEEKDFYGVTHADIGAWLVHKWNFPLVLIESIKYHHNPMQSKNAKTHCCIVNLADIIIKAFGFGYSGDDLIPLLDPSILTILKIDENILREIIKEVFNEIEDEDSLNFD